MDDCAPWIVASQDLVRLDGDTRQLFESWDAMCLLYRLWAIASSHAILHDKCNEAFARCFREILLTWDQLGYFLLDDTRIKETGVTWARRFWHSFLYPRCSYALEDVGGIPLSALIEDHSERRTEIFSIVASITRWCIWRERCRLALGG